MIREWAFFFALLGAVAGFIAGIALGVVAVIVQAPTIGVAAAVSFVSGFALTIATLHLQTDEEDW